MRRSKRMNSIEIDSLTKRYGDITAVDDISLSVEEGELFGFLGPNGAGKSTTMMILTTLLKPTSGRVLVAGYDAGSRPSKVRENIGYVQQETAVDEFMTGRENLAFSARINRIPGSVAKGRIDETLSLMELEERQNDMTITYSGGMKKRLDIAAGLLHRPKVLLLDEPTVGLDIQTRRRIWEHLRDVHNEYGITMFVTTHYMEEADKLCDEVGIIDRGRIQNVGRPADMKNALGSQVITLAISGGSLDAMASELREVDRIKKVSQEKGRILVYTYGGEDIIPDIFKKAARQDVRVTSLSLTQPTLDDVFLSYTGHEIRDEAQPRGAQVTGHRRRMV